MATRFVCSSRYKKNVLLIAMAATVLLTMVQLTYLSSSFSDSEVTNINSIISEQFEPSSSSRQDLKSDFRRNHSTAQYRYPWGHIYASRVWCSVLTMWPERRENIEAVMATWAPLCNRIIFVVDNTTARPAPAPAKSESAADRKKRIRAEMKYKKKAFSWEPAPSTHRGFDFVRLPMELPQSEGHRNIWQKSWRMWRYVARHHMDDAEWFLKIDDDTFFSPVNFKGFARYFDPERAWYLGHTMLHLWRRRNVVFNAGSCYALSRGALLRLQRGFESASFESPSAKRRSLDVQWRGCLCVDRPGAYEDATMGICLRSIGISPTSTLDGQLRARFSPYRERYHRRLERQGREEHWFFKLQPERMGVLDECCAEHMVSFHYYKHEQVKLMAQLHARYNQAEGVEGKRFDVPQEARPFLHRAALNFSVDAWGNSLDSTDAARKGQLVYMGPGKERVCWTQNASLHEKYCDD